MPGALAMVRGLLNDHCRWEENQTVWASPGREKGWGMLANGGAVTQATAKTITAALTTGLQTLCSRQQPDGSWSGSGTRSSLLETALALQTLHACGEGSEARARALRWLEDRQHSDGSWSADPRLTLAALQALAGAVAEQSWVRGWQWLLQRQPLSGTWTVGPDDQENLLWNASLLQAIGTWGTGHLRVRRLLESILPHQQADGSFGTLRATAEVLEALHAAGLPAENPMVQRATDWLQRQRDNEEAWGEASAAVLRATRDPSAAAYLCHKAGADPEALLALARFLHPQPVRCLCPSL